MPRLCIFIFALLVSDGAATSAAEWQSSEPGRSLEFTVHAPSGGHTSSPTVVYLKQLATPRVGAESDATILTDFRTAGYLVVELDFANHTNARVPFINRDLGKLRDDIRAKKFLAEYKLDDAHIFIVPECAWQSLLQHSLLSAHSVPTALQVEASPVEPSEAASGLEVSSPASLCGHAAMHRSADALQVASVASDSPSSWHF